jgi:hypothetical protein
LEFVDRPHDGVHVATQFIREASQGTTQVVPVRLSNDEEVDVAAELIRSRCVRAEEERELNAAHRREYRPQAGGNSGSASHEIPQRRHELAALVDSPEAEISEASTLDETCLEQLLESALDGMRIGVDAPCDLARV